VPEGTERHEDRTELVIAVTMRHNSTMSVTRLPPVVPAVVAGRCLGMQRTSTYSALASGTFPLKAIRAGGRWMVSTAELCRVLDLSNDELADLLDLDADRETAQAS
jgi:hypothetical protein